MGLDVVAPEDAHFSAVTIMDRNFSNHLLKMCKMALILLAISTSDDGCLYFSKIIEFHFRIHMHSKEYGFGQSLLHEGQLVFHTPPYSLQPVSLQEGHESFGKANIRISRPDVDQKSPLSHHKYFDQSPKPKDIGSPSTLDRKNRRFSYANSRYVSHLLSIQ